MLGPENMETPPPQKKTHLLAGLYQRLDAVVEHEPLPGAKGAPLAHVSLDDEQADTEIN